jgi:hypothetical protein
MNPFVNNEQMPSPSWAPRTRPPTFLETLKVGVAIVLGLALGEMVLSSGVSHRIVSKIRRLP